jgi:hypothetical protein
MFLVGALPRHFAFAAKLTHDVRPADLGTHGILRFDGVLINEGNGYNPSTGVFTCSTNGTYVFSWTYIVSVDSRFHTQLMINSQPYVSSLADSEGEPHSHTHVGGPVATGTHTTVAHMNVGDVAFVRAASAGSGQVYYGFGQQDKSYCTFSGFLLH